MAYKKISDLTAVTTPATTDLVEIEQSGTSYKATVAQITGAPNGGQPPAAKPRFATDSDIGQWKHITAGDNTDLNLPSGGSWAFYSIYYKTSDSYTYSTPNASVAAGGTTIRGAIAGFSSYAFVWRIA